MNYNNKVVTSIVVNETVKLDIGYTCTNRADLNQKKKKYIKVNLWKWKLRD